MQHRIRLRPEGVPGSVIAFEHRLRSANAVRFGLLQLEGNRGTEGNCDIRPVPDMRVVPRRIPDSLNHSLATSRGEVGTQDLPTAAFSVQLGALLAKPLRQQLHDGGFA